MRLIAAASRRRSPRAQWMIGWTAVGLVASLLGSGWASQYPELDCRAARVKAAGKYAKCIQNQVAKGLVFRGTYAAFGKCARNYGRTWDKLQARASGTGGACDAARFVDNGDGTVTDSLSTLQWEKKTDDATIHDKDNVYTWSDSGTLADGTVFRTFLPTVNGAGFAGQYDWRLPTLVELLSITQPVYPDCSTPPCIDAIFGPTQSTVYWSSSASQQYADEVWVVGFDNASPFTTFRIFDYPVRAVRGGF